jgi:hypothetical protein
MAKRYHWCSNCPHYPHTVWSVLHERPGADELCEACLLREQRGECAATARPPLESHGAELLDRLS